MYYPNTTFFVIILKVIFTKGYRYAYIWPLQGTPGIYYEYINPLQVIGNMVEFSLHINLTTIQHNTSILRNFINNVHQCPDTRIDCKALMVRNEYLLYLLALADKLFDKIGTLTSGLLPSLAPYSRPQDLPSSFNHYPVRIPGGSVPNTNSIVIYFSEIIAFQHDLQNLFREVLLEGTYLSENFSVKNTQYYIKVQSWTTTLDAFLTAQISTYEFLLQIITLSHYNQVPTQLHAHFQEAYSIRMDPDTELYFDSNFLTMKLWGASPILSLDLKVPTLDRTIYQVYKIYSVPAPQNGPKSAFIAPNHTHILVHMNDHALINYNQLSECVSNMNRFICLRGFTIIQGRSCESEMLIDSSNTSATLCNIVFKEITDPYWTYLTYANLWLFTTEAPTVLQVQCSGSVELVLLQNSGLLSLRPECSAISGETSITSTTTIKRTNIFIYKPTFNLSISSSTLDQTFIDLLHPTTITKVIFISFALTCVNCSILIIMGIYYCTTRFKRPAPNPIVEPFNRPSPPYEIPYYEVPRPVIPSVPLLRDHSSVTYANL